MRAAREGQSKEPDATSAAMQRYKTLNPPGKRAPAAGLIQEIMPPLAPKIPPAASERPTAAPSAPAPPPAAQSTPVFHSVIPMPAEEPGKLLLVAEGNKYSLTADGEFVVITIRGPCLPPDTRVGDLVVPPWADSFVIARAPMGFPVGSIEPFPMQLHARAFRILPQRKAPAIEID